ncbi:MAG TPA: serine hydrolase domain-containing protein [Actinomycetota bacterium]|nr:serine hydrolase domain-containing protein [Actinomycetota bacterium]
MLTAENCPTDEGAAEVLGQVCSRRKIPGAVLGVMVDGEVVARATFGLANAATGLPVSDETIFHAGSIGKVYTATVLMTLVDEGSVDLDAPVKNYMQDFELADGNATKSVTIRQLLTHTSAIDGDALDEEGNYGRGDDCLERYVADMNNLPMIAEPGSLWSYCNSGYILLGRLIEVITGSTYEDAMSERLLQPLGLQKTFYFPEQVMPHSFAVGHIPNPEGPPNVSPIWAFNRAAHPAGGNISTTIDELLAFGRLHLNGGVAPDGTRILSEDSVRAMQTAAAPCPEPELLGDQWGLGWFLRTQAGPATVAHDGNTHGQTAGLRLIPDRDAVVGILTNLSGQNYAFMEIAHELIDPWLGTQTPGKSQGSRPASPPDANRFVGLYEKLGGRIRVSLQDGVLHATVEPTGAQAEMQEADPKPRSLKTVSEDRFLMPIEEIGDEMPLTFLHPDAKNEPRFVHFGGRAFPRVQ